MLLEWLDQIYAILWGPLLMFCLAGLGVYLTIRLRGVQFRYLFYGIKLIFVPPKAQGGAGDVSHFQALMMALAAAIGIGNVAGVATAVAIGGLGSLFWMWVITLIGMATKYAEAILSVKYRSLDEYGEMAGGPMYYIEKGLGWKKFAAFFAGVTAISAFGGGNMVQANSVADALEARFGLDPWITAIGMTLVIGVTLIGGVKGIARVSSVIVPFMALLYAGGGLLILLLSYDQIPSAILTVVREAFTGSAPLGGFAGATVMMGIQMGFARGLMSSEAGMGTGGIAAAAAKTDTPGRQALISMAGTFLGSFVMCTITALVLAVTHVLGTTGPNGKLLNGAPMTVEAFNQVIPGGGLVVTIGIVLFAFTTILGWAYYGEKCVEYLVGYRFRTAYRLVFSLAVLFGALLDLNVVWRIADVGNAILVIPNMIALFALTPVVVQETHHFRELLDKEESDLQVVPLTSAEPASQ